MSTNKSKANNKETDKSKGKEKDDKVSLPSVNQGKAGAAAGGNKTTSNATNTPKKGNDQAKSAQVEKLPAIKSNKTATPDATSTSVDKVTEVTPTVQTNKEEAVPNAVIAADVIPPVTAEVTTANTENVDTITAPTTAALTTPTPVDPPAPVKPPQNGKVTLIYEQYNEQFDITNGSTTQENIDEVYCLSFVMPNCLVHLSTLNPQEKRKQEAEGNLDLFIKEDPRGTYQGLDVDQTYYVYVEQEAEQLARDQARMKQIASSMEGAKKKDANGNLVKDDGRVLESCSCIYGNPCVDEYGCKDWGNRFAVATKNGWKGF